MIAKNGISLLKSLKCYALLALVLVIFHPGWASAQSLGPSGYPLPRFASLGSSKINVRHGPGQKYDVAWIFVQNGLPVEIIQEFDAWRKIRDSEGAEGWVHKTLLSGRRTALVTPWLADKESEGTMLFARADKNSAQRAVLHPGVLLTLDGCDTNWCEISGRYKKEPTDTRSQNFSGYIDQSALWGVYQNEELD